MPFDTLGTNVQHMQRRKYCNVVRGLIPLLWELWQVSLHELQCNEVQWEWKALYETPRVDRSAATSLFGPSIFVRFLYGSVMFRHVLIVHSVVQKLASCTKDRSIRPVEALSTHLRTLVINRSRAFPTERQTASTSKKCRHTRSFSLKKLTNEGARMTVELSQKF